MGQGKIGRLTNRYEWVVAENKELLLSFSVIEPSVE